MVDWIRQVGRKAFGIESKDNPTNFSDLGRSSNDSCKPSITTPSEKLGGLSAEPNIKLGQQMVYWIRQVGRKAFGIESKDNPTNFSDLSRSSNDSCKPSITTPSEKLGGLSAELNIKYSQQNGRKQFDLKATVAWPTKAM